MYPLCHLVGETDVHTLIGRSDSAASHLLELKPFQTGQTSNLKSNDKELKNLIRTPSIKFGNPHYFRKALVFLVVGRLSLVAGKKGR